MNEWKELFSQDWTIAALFSGINEKLLSRQNSPVASMYVAEPLTPRVPAHSLGLDPSGCAKGKNLNL